MQKQLIMLQGMGIGSGVYLEPTFVALVAIIKW